MKVTTSNISRHDLPPDAPKWIDPLFDFLIQFTNKVKEIINGNVQFGDNIRSKQIETTFSTSATYSSGDFAALSFTIPFAPIDIRLINITKIGSGTNTFTDPVVINPNWVFDSGTNQITIYFITGLQNSTEYSIKVLII